MLSIDKDDPVRSKPSLTKNSFLVSKMPAEQSKFTKGTGAVRQEDYCVTRVFDELEFFGLSITAGTESDILQSIIFSGNNFKLLGLKRRS